MPPWTHLAKLVLSGLIEKEVLRQIAELGKLLKEKLPSEHYRVLGPAPSVISKEKGLYRWNLFVQAVDADRIASDLRDALKDFK
jgi:primosomal protein N'